MPIPRITGRHYNHSTFFTGWRVNSNSRNCNCKTPWPLIPVNKPTIFSNKLQNARCSPIESMSIDQSLSTKVSRLLRADQNGVTTQHHTDVLNMWDWDSHLFVGVMSPRHDITPMAVFTRKCGVKWNDEWEGIAGAFSALPLHFPSPPPPSLHSHSHFIAKASQTASRFVIDLSDVFCHHMELQLRRRHST